MGLIFISNFSSQNIYSVFRESEWNNKEAKEENTLLNCKKVKIHIITHQCNHYDNKIED